jgi:metallophosphoesterase (TIGR00282 family)
MKILFIGDIVSYVGREAVRRMLPALRAEFAPDYIIANGENTSHGRGLGRQHYEELREAGIDLFTGGNHSFERKDSLEMLADDSYKKIRPANYENRPGRGVYTETIGKNRLIVVNLQGQVFMNHKVKSPFHSVDEILADLEVQKDDVILVDFHAEATAEKVAIAHYLDGRVSAIVGTHTHVQTADERIMPNKTVYITDVGGCYEQNSIIGVEKQAVLQRFLTDETPNFEFARSGTGIVQGVFLEFEGRWPQRIERFQKIVQIAS